MNKAPSHGNRESETRNAGTMPYVYSPPNWLYQKGSDTRAKTANGNTASIGGLATHGNAARQRGQVLQNHIPRLS